MLPRYLELIDSPNRTSATWLEGEPQLLGLTRGRGAADRAQFCQVAGAAAAAVSATERKRLRNIGRTCGWLGAPDACRLWTGKHR